LLSIGVFVVFVSTNHEDKVIEKRGVVMKILFELLLNRRMLNLIYAIEFMFTGQICLTIRAKSITHKSNKTPPIIHN
jgi:hypothetical protein